MTSEEMSNLVSNCIESLRSRIMGTGQDQYSNGNQQAIELKTDKELIQETLEELEDGLVYLAVLHSRISNLLGKIN